MADQTVNSVNKAILILECFAHNQTEWNISALAKQTDLPLTTLHRLLSTLVKAGYLKQEPVRKTYCVGSRFILLSSALMNKYDLKNIAHPILQELSSKTGETAHLCQLDNFSMFYVDKVESVHSLICASRIGVTAIPHTTAAGKVLLSGQSEEYLSAYCKLLPSFHTPAEKAIRTESELQCALADVQKLGYALDNEENEAGVMCIAAPIYDNSNNLCAAISVSGPLFRLAEQVHSMIPQVREYANRISLMLGHQS